MTFTYFLFSYRNIWLYRRSRLYPVRCAKHQSDHGQQILSPMMCQTSKWSQTAGPVPVRCAKHQTDHGQQILSPYDLRNIKVITDSRSCLYDVPNIKVITDIRSWLCGTTPLNIRLDQSICVKTSSVFGRCPCAIRVRVYILTWCGIQFPAIKKNCSLFNANSAFPLTVFHLLDRYLVYVI
jgi:hypothetical protein